MLIECNQQIAYLLCCLTAAPLLFDSSNLFTVYFRFYLLQMHKISFAYALLVAFSIACQLPAFFLFPSKISHGALLFHYFRLNKQRTVELALQHCFSGQINEQKQHICLMRQLTCLVVLGSLKVLLL